MLGFQIKTGVLLIIIGMVGFFFEETHQMSNLYPTIFGALVAGAGVWAERVVYSRHVALQIATMATLCLIPICGAVLYKEINVETSYPAVSVAEALVALWVCWRSAFTTSTAFQDEFAGEDRDDASSIKSGFDTMEKET